MRNDDEGAGCIVEVKPSVFTTKQSEEECVEMFTLQPRLKEE